MRSKSCPWKMEMREKGNGEAKTVPAEGGNEGERER